MLPLDETVVLASANMGQPLVMSDGPLTDLLTDLAKDILGKHESRKILERIKSQNATSMSQIKDKVFDFINDVTKKL